MTEANLPAAGTAPAARVGIVASVVRNPLGVAALVVLGLVVAGALLAPLLAPFDPRAVRIDLINAPVGGEYPLGGDSAGRDILSRLLFAAGNTLLGTSIAVAVALALGVSAGLVGGYAGRLFDAVASWTSSVLMAIPAMIVLLALFRSFGSSVFTSMAVFGVLLAPGFYRLVRSLVVGVKDELYVDAARVSGLSDIRIGVRHILGVVRAPVVIQASVVAGIAIILQAGLEFLGLGDPGTPTWGGMLQDAFNNIYVTPTAIIWPGGVIAVTVAALILLGNAVRDGMQRVSARAPRRLGAPERRVASAPLPADGGSGALLRVEGLVVGYPTASGTTRVVRGVDLAIERGEVLGLVGESGSGKSQTAFSILGLLPEGGHVLAGGIRFDGIELSTLPERERARVRGRRIAYIPQEPMSNLDPSFRIGSQLTEPLRLVGGLSARDAEQRALELLDRVGIRDPRRTFDAYPHEISGGMAQRVLIAGAVACGPDLLIADEPTTALDVTVQAEVLDLLRGLQRESGMAMLLVTHNLGVVADICDRVAVMRDGEIVETADVHALFDSPQHPYTRMLLDATLDDAEPRRALDPTPRGAA